MARGQYDRAAARAKRDGADAPPAPMVPAAVRLTRDHGYIETRFNRGVFHWAAGTVLTNPDEIAHLMERGVELEPIECPEASPSAPTR